MVRIGRKRRVKVPAVIDSFMDEHFFLSNFYPAPVYFDGHTYPTSEHAYQAAKTVSKSERKMVRELPTAGRAKRIGNDRELVTLRHGWEGMKINVMREIVRHKFFENIDLRKKLVATYPATLIEGNDWGDEFWARWTGVERTGSARF